MWGTGSKVRDLGALRPLVGSRGEAPVGGLEDDVPEKLKSFLKNRY